MTTIQDYYVASTINAQWLHYLSFLCDEFVGNILRMHTTQVKSEIIKKNKLNIN